MQRLAALVVASALAVTMSGSPMLCGVTRAQPADSAKKDTPPSKPADTGKAGAPPSKPEANSPGAPFEAWAIVVGAILVVGVCVVLWFAAKVPPQPNLLKLGPSFFFWLAMGYLGLLLLFGYVYSNALTYLIAGILPAGVPWFGALGAVIISLEGVFLRNAEWDTKFNFWHIGRPLFGAVLGIVAFFIFFLMVNTSGTTPEFLQNNPPKAKDLIVFYVVAFLVGYREETFRDLIKRATDMILKPGSPPAETPALVFQVEGSREDPAHSVDFGEVDPGIPQKRTVTIKNNSSKEPLVKPTVNVTTTKPSGQQAFGLDKNQLTDKDELGPGQSQTVDVTLTAESGVPYEGKLTVQGKNLPGGQGIPLLAKGKKASQ